jgi:D-alanine-D-alanine ligase
MKINAKIVVCYNSPVSVYSLYTGKEHDSTNVVQDLSENSFAQEIDIIISSLKNYFTEVEILPIDRNVSSTFFKLNTIAPDVIFNFVESVEGIASFESYNAGVYELMDIPYTGNRPQTLANCLNKAFTKHILKAFNIKTPSYIICREEDNLSEADFELTFPVITKLLKEDASIGISENSVVNNFEALKKQINFLFEHFKQEIIIEEFIEGREFNVALLGDKPLPISEIKFDGLPDGLPKIVTYEGKWVADTVYYKNTVPSCPAIISKQQKKILEETAINAFSAIECRDYARVDIRLTDNDIPYVIEVNPNPDISTDSGFSRAASAAGLSYPELLFTIASFALKRGDHDSQNKAV